MRRGGEVLRFAAVGVIGVAAYLALVVGLRDVLVAGGAAAVTAAQTANLTSRVVTSFATTWLNVRLTFRSRAGLLRCWLAGLGALAAGAAVSAAALGLLHLLLPVPGRTAEAVVLGLTQVAQAGVRFAVIRRAVRPAGTQQRPTVVRDRRPSVGRDREDVLLPLTPGAVR